MFDPGNLGLYCAFGSSLCLAFTIIFDRLMVGDCYRNMPAQAWLVSALAGSFYGLVATAICWVAYAGVTGIGIASLANRAIALALPNGLVMLGAGAITVQTMCHYFRLFVPERGQDVNETAVALWLSSSPLFIFISIYALNSFGVQIAGFDGLAAANISLKFGVAVAVVVLAFVLFEKYDGGDAGRGRMNYAEVGKMLGCIVAYTLIIAATVNQTGFGTTEALALQPYYWFGFLAGARVWLKPSCRADFKANWKRLRKFLRVIGIVEVLGMSVYFLEVFALSDVDPTLVNLIIGGHVTVVFLFGVALGFLRRRMQAHHQKRQWLFGLRFVQHKLPELDLSVGRVARLLFAQASLVAAMMFA